ncbi:MAG: LysM domain-containing protein, partial [Anaerolineae bacterium]|nr:LysM domain-containing protein [Anaerolineae bacterium]
MQQPLTNKPPDVPALDAVPQTDGGSLTNLINANAPSIPSSLSLFNYAKRFWRKYLSDNYHKNASHAAFFLVVVIAIGMSSFDLSVFEAGRIRAFMQRLVLFPTVETGESALALFSPPSELTDRRNGVFQRVTAPFTPPTLEAEVAIGSPDRLLPSGELNINNNYEIAYYSVEPGDTIFGIAAKFGLAPETIMWSNESLGNNP